MGVYSNTGSDPARPQKVNQDAYFFNNKTISNALVGPSYTCMGVLDGHGLKGHVVSTFLSQQLPDLFQFHLERLLRSDNNGGFSGGTDADDSEILKQLVDLEDTLEQLGGLSRDEIMGSNRSFVQQALICAFHSAHAAATNNPEVPAGRNGATCIMVAVDRDSHSDDVLLHVAHVGDSRVIHVEIGDSGNNNNNNNNNNNIKVSQLSSETTIRMEIERRRIEQGEGIVRGTNVFYGPIGIAMTRSLGNAVMLRAGVVPTPMVDSFAIPKSSNSFLVLATDGIWDVLSNEVVGDLLMTHVQSSNNTHTSTLETICFEIADAARQKWIGDLPIVDEEKIDDITCMVVHIC